MFAISNNPILLVLIFIRITSMVSFSIFFGDKRISSFAKVGLSLILAIIIAPTVAESSELIKIESTTLAAISEFIVGSVIGLSTTVITHTFAIAGSLIDTQGGFGMAQVYDPSTKSQSSLMSQLLVTVSLMLFVSQGLHVELLRVFIKSFVAVPIGGMVNIEATISIMLKCIMMGSAIAIPVISLIFMIDILLGLSSKTMPQLNLFSVGYIVKCFTTVFCIYIYAGAFSNITRYVTNVVFDLILNNLY